MGSLGRAGRRITALVGREVKRTFSEFRNKSAGLPDLEPRERLRQQRTNFGQPLACVVAIKACSVHRQIQFKSNSF